MSDQPRGRPDRDLAEEASTHRQLWLDGPCPMLLCLNTGRHAHPICPECEAVDYGNLFCATCRRFRPLVNRSIDETIGRMKAERGDT